MKRKELLRWITAMLVFVISTTGLTTFWEYMQREYPTYDNMFEFFLITLTIIGAGVFYVALVIWMVIRAIDTDDELFKD